MADPTKGIGALGESSELLNNSGINYLLAIAIDEYKNLPPLFNPVSDAEAFIELMIERYRFEEEQVTRIFNGEATEPNIYGAFRKLIETVKPEDNVVIYYSGHGEFDQVLDEGYWIPVNAHSGAINEYIANDTIRRFISRINSHHTFLVSDSCFAGSLFSSGASKNVSKRYERDPSRWGLTAGRKEIVSDGKPGMHSPFADALLYRLRTSSEPLGVQELCSYVVEQVEANANQSPIGEPLKVDGHKNGQFVFHLKKDETRDWNEATAADTVDGYVRFLTMYPAGAHTEEASWKLAQKKDDILSHVEYLDAYPRGIYQRQAEKRLAQLEDERDWEETLRINTIMAFRKYRESHPKGTYLQEADQRIHALLGGTSTPPPPPRSIPKPATKPAPQPVTQRPAQGASAPAAPSGLGKRNKLILFIGGPLLAVALIIWGLGKAGSRQTGGGPWACTNFYDECKELRNADGQLYYFVRRGTVWGLVTDTGDEIVPPLFEEIYPFDANGLALAKKTGKYGWIDWQGNPRISFSFDYANLFEGDSAKVTLNNRSFYIDTDGQEKTRKTTTTDVSEPSTPTTTPSTPPASPASSVNNNLTKLVLEVSNSWDDLWKKADLSWDGCKSYVPEVGCRGRYAAVKRLASLKMLERITGEPVFLSGPHRGDLDLMNNTSFGYYNPKFLDKVFEFIQSINDNPKLIQVLQPFYDKQLKNYIRVYALARKEFSNNQELAIKYKRYIESGKPNASIYSLGNEIDPFIQEMTSKGYDVYEAYAVPSFWVRRTIDGTADQFSKIFGLTMRIFDQDLQSERRK